MLVYVSEMDVHSLSCSVTCGRYTMGTILRHGSDDQKETWLPQIASGLKLQVGASVRRSPQLATLSRIYASAHISPAMDTALHSVRH